MINERSIKHVNASLYRNIFRKPLYGSYCFSNIAPSVKKILTGRSNASLPDDAFGNLPQSYDNAILFYIDGVGWKTFERLSRNIPFLKRTRDNGVISKITSQFPSTTTAHVTSIHTGEDVGKSGFYEWFYYEPHIDAIYSPLLYSYAQKSERGSLNNDKTLERKILPQKTLYQELDAADVRSVIYQPSEYSHSPYSRAIGKGATLVGYKSPLEALLEIDRFFSENPYQKKYVMYYFDAIDAISHRHKPDSEFVIAEIEYFFDAIERFLLPKIRNNSAFSDTAIMLTTDHGQIASNPKNIIYIDKEIPEVIPYIERNSQGNLIIPAGSPRNLVLHVKKNYIDKVMQLLLDKLGHVAEVIMIEELVSDGIFGGTISDVFHSRIGNVMILARDNVSVFWYGQDGEFEQKKHGYHGGMTPEEMDIHFSIVPVNSL